MNFRIKYWYVLCGGNIMVTLISAASHLMFFTAFGVVIAIGCWYMAEWLLNKDLDSQEEKL